MPRKKGLTYLTFGSLYFTQGTIQGFFAALNALYLLDNGLNLTDVGIFGFIALLPFVLKIGLGILSDRVNLFGLGTSQTLHHHRIDRPVALPGIHAIHQPRRIFLGVCRHCFHPADGHGTL